MKKSFFLVLIFFFSFSVSNLHLNAKTINITGDRCVSEKRQTFLLKNIDFEKNKVEKQFWGHVICEVCFHLLAECICGEEFGEEEKLN